MQKRDGRSIPDAALEVLRERAVAMHEAGNSQLAIAAALGVHKNTVHQWLKGWRVAGAAALKAKKRGRRHEAQRLLDVGQAAEVQRLMTGHTPDQLELPFALWGREAVRELARARFGVTLALRTVSDDLRRLSTSSTSRRGIGPEGPMGFTPQRPIKRALERQDAAIQAWLAEHDPKIAARAKAEGAAIHWGDETGISNQAVHGRSFAPKGQTPVLRRPATRRTLSMISAVTNRGTLRFMLYEGALNAGLFLTFLQRLVRSARGKVFLIVDNLKVHKAGKVEAWVTAHRDRIELFFLPAYAPEHNPDEFLHSDLKRSLGRRPAVKDKAGLESRLRGYLRRLQRQPHRVRAFFQAPTTRYAA
jgi:transposase